MKLLSLAIALLHAVAVLTPCPGDGLGDLVVREQAEAPAQEPAASAHAHRGHAAHDSGHAAAHGKPDDASPPPILKARCGCGCRSAPAAATAANARIGHALLPASPHLAAFAIATDIAVRPASARSAPLSSIDHVPIAS